MPRDRDRSADRGVFECVAGFSPALRAGERVPVSYRPGQLVSSSDPILRTHGEFFAPAADRVERMTAAPGERREVGIPRSEPVVPADEESESSDG